MLNSNHDNSNNSKYIYFKSYELFFYPWKLYLLEHKSLPLFKLEICILVIVVVPHGLWGGGRTEKAIPEEKRINPSCSLKGKPSIIFVRPFILGFSTWWSLRQHVVLRLRRAPGLHIPIGVALTLCTLLQISSESLLNPEWARIMRLIYPPVGSLGFLLRKWINFSRCLGIQPSHE